MKTQLVTRFAILAAVVSAVSYSITSCHKIPTPSAMGTFYFRIYNNIDTSVADSTSPYFYFDSLGRYISLKVPQFFISNIVLQTSTGVTYPITGVYLLTDLDSQNYLVGAAPVGTYNSVSFNVGLDPAANAEDPSLLTTNGWGSDYSMWFGNTTYGYMAMNVQGLYDTTSTYGHRGSGINPIRFSFAIPNPAAAITITMPVRGTAALPAYQLSIGGSQYINITCDYGGLLDALNLKTQDSTDGLAYRIGIADTLTARIPSMFRYKQ